MTAPWTTAIAIALQMNCFQPVCDWRHINQPEFAIGRHEHEIQFQNPEGVDTVFALTITGFGRCFALVNPVVEGVPTETSYDSRGDEWTVRFPAKPPYDQWLAFHYEFRDACDESGSAS